MVVGLYGLWVIAFLGFSFLGFTGFGNSLGKSGPPRVVRANLRQSCGRRDAGREDGTGGQGRKKGVKKSRAEGSYKSLRTL